MRNLVVVVVFGFVAVAVTTSATAQCRGRSHGGGYRTVYYAPAPVVVVPSYGYSAVNYGYSPRSSVGYRSYYGGYPNYRGYYGGYGGGYGYPRSGISISIGGYGW